MEWRSVKIGDLYIQVYSLYYHFQARKGSNMAELMAAAQGKSISCIFIQYSLLVCQNSAKREEVKKMREEGVRPPAPNPKAK